MSIRGAVLVLLFLSPSLALAQSPAGGPFRINSYVTGDQARPVVAAEPAGGFTVVWERFDVADFGSDVFGQRFDRAGARRGGEFRVNVYTTQNQGEADIAADGRGNLVVVWGGAGPGGEAAIYGQRFAADGSRRGAEFRASTVPLSGVSMITDAVAADAAGNFVVVWNNRAPSAVFGQRFASSGAAVGGEFRISASTADAFLADVAADPSGGFVVVWSSYAPEAGRGIRGRRFDSAGAPLGPDFDVAPQSGVGLGGPRVGTDDKGNFVVAWSTSLNDILVRRFDRNGAAFAEPFRVNTSTTDGASRPALAVAPSGDFVVTWQGYTFEFGGSYDVFGQRFTASGSRRGAQFRANTFTMAAQQESDVAADGAGNLIIAWRSYLEDGDGWGLFGQRLGGMLPVALGVDTPDGSGTMGDRNGVLEPGEGVDVSPWWHNASGLAQIFDGWLTEFTGPGGNLYSIQEPRSAYFLVPDGTARECAACYHVSVLDPPARPALHWDASALESLTPDTLGERKRWRLHIGDSFSDVPRASAFYRFVEVVLHHGITSGCDAASYCPASPITRAQAAVFALAAKEGAGYAPVACGMPVFADVPAASPFCRWIEELVRRGVTAGCGGGNFCPQQAVTREQMAVLILRTAHPALDPPSCGMPMFADVPDSSPYCRWIEELVRRGVTAGCGGGNFCPQQAVTREQMAVFIVKTFDLSLYGP